MFAHQDEQVNNIFLCQSTFKRFEPEPEEGINADPTPAEYKKDEIEYLPGERLLIKLNKERKKERNKKKNKQKKMLSRTQKKSRENNIDVERVSASLARVLKSF